jgi:septal ring factor EnvC (AmiA/AmiB activator)
MNLDVFLFIGGVLLVMAIIIFLVSTFQETVNAFSQDEREQWEQELARADRKLERQQDKHQRELENERNHAEEALAKARQAACDAEENAQAIVANTNWKRKRLNSTATSRQIAAIVEEAGRVQPRRGRLLSVNALVSPSGFVLEWKVEARGMDIPAVTGACDGEHMFTEYAYLGRHSALVGPGRYLLMFSVGYNGRPSTENDLSFEVYVPEALPTRTRTDTIEQAAKKFVKRTAAIARVKKRITKQLTKQGADSDEIDVQLGKFEGQLQKQTNAK